VPCSAGLAKVAEVLPQRPHGLRVGGWWDRKGAGRRSWRRDGSGGAGGGSGGAGGAGADERRCSGEERSSWGAGKGNDSRGEEKSGRDDDR